MVDLNLPPQVSSPGFRVVASGSGPLSVWPTDLPLPPSWRSTTVTGTREQCLAAVDRMAAPLIDGDGRCGAAACGHRSSLLSVLAESRRRYGDRPAVGDSDRTLSYEQLDAAADRLAAALVRHGVSAGDRVALSLPRGIDVFVAMLGVLKAGAAYVPIDTRYPAGRRDQMIAASGAVVTLTDPRVSADPLPGPSLLVGELTGSDVPAGVPAEVTGCQAAAVLFTSGSTGQPKPIVLDHRNIAHFALNKALPALRPTDRVAHVSSLSFDAFHFEAWCSLAAGAEIVVLSSLSDLVNGDLQRELRRHRVTVMLAPTMAFNQVLLEDRESFTGLRVLHTGGDVISPAACRDLLAGSFDGDFYNLYGPTEGTTACTAYHVTAVVDGADTVPIGTALDGTEVHLLDEALRQVPVGEVGEIHIGGAGVARGYLGLPRLTAERFLPDPFHGEGGRMYRTGDLARRRPDGLIEFMGRADDQVKIRGYRVEPREAERILLRRAGVRDCAVVAVGDADARHLVALLVTDGDTSLTELRRYAGEVMPDFLVPSMLVRVPSIPANSHGKRDMTKLRELARGETRRLIGYVAPRDDIERHLADVWEDLLSVERVGVADDFFALGGNSLLAFRMRRRLNRDLAVSLDMHEVLRSTVLSELAGLVRDRRGAVTS